MKISTITFDLSDLLFIFDKSLNLSNEELGIYFLKYVRDDNYSILLDFNKYERDVSVLLYSPHIELYSIHLVNCTDINVLDLENRQLEILANIDGKISQRIFLDLNGTPIVNLSSELSKL